MTNYVLTLAVGPVQGFIASARRSRDLWAGSWLLSELAKAVAKNLHDNGKDKVDLIFPYVEYEKDLLPESEFSVGNKIQVVIKNSSKDEVVKIADAAKNAANKHFKIIAENVKEQLTKYILRDDIWNEQVGDYVEVQYAWAAIKGDDYLSGSKNAASLLAARKATRDFAPLSVTADADGHCIPKSSLDGARETVLPEYDDNKKPLPTGLRNKLGLNQSEQLDCAGVVKRLCGDTEQFTPITRVAANDWINKIVNIINDKYNSNQKKSNNVEHDKLKDNWTQAKEKYECLVNHNLATYVSGNGGIYADFPYDAGLLYRSRLDAEIVRMTAQLKAHKVKTKNIAKLEDEDEREIAQLEEIKILLEDLRKILQKIWKECGEPCPYYAMLLADGDKMGELLDNAKEQKHHEYITQSLSTFAQGVPDVMRKNNAQCVYSGGDDVLGLAALSDVVKCAEDLKDKFSGSLKDISEKLGAETPTLSVGVAICHINTPLGNVRALAKRAEKVAKGDNYDQPRNALGITLAVRSGATTDMRLRWSDKAAQRYFKFWIKHYSNYLKHDVHGLSSRIAYDCRDIFIRTDFSKPDTDLQNKIRVAEFDRMLEKAQTNNGKPLSKRVKTILRCRLRRLNNNLNDLATELITARWLAAKTQRDLGRDN